MNPHLDRNLSALRSVISSAKPKKELIGDLKRDLKPGWLLPYLLETDMMLWQRWDHWAETMQAGRILDETIPPIHWTPHGNDPARKMLERCLDCVTRYGSWRGWSSWQYMDFFLDWLLYGFGYIKTPPEEPHGCDGASMRLYQMFSLETLLAYPNDYFGDILAENCHGKQNGFFPTPMDIVCMMVKMQMDTGEDMRCKTVCDPCTGTGRMLLYAGEFSYRLYGNDIDRTVIKCTIINGYLFVPWLAKPFPETFFGQSEAPTFEAPQAENIKLNYQQSELLLA